LAKSVLPNQVQVGLARALFETVTVEGIVTIISQLYQNEVLVVAVKV
jgi:hypothetical protein